jgi:hypothetical protein
MCLIYFQIFGISVIVVICITIFMQGKSVTDELSLNTVTSLVLVTGILAILGCVVFAPVLCFPACCTKCFILAVSILKLNLLMEFCVALQLE